MERRKLIILSLAAFFLFAAIYFLLNYTVLTISSANPDNKTIYLNDGRNFKQLNLEEGSKTILLKRSDYNIEVSAGDKLSRYTKSLGYLWNNELEVEVTPQKHSKFLGESELPCASNTSNQTVFYSCNPSTLGIVSKDGSIDAGLEHDHDHSTEDTDEKNIDNFSLVLKPYKEGFLEAETTNNQLVIRQLDKLGKDTGQHVELNDFEGKVTDKIFSTSSQNESFAVLDDQRNQLHLFNDLSMSSHKSIEIDDKKLDKINYEITVVAGEKLTYFLSYSVTLDRHDLEGSIEEEDPPSAEPRIMVFENGTGAQVAEHEISNEWQIRDISGEAGDRINFVLSGNRNDELYIIDGENEPKRLDLFTDSPQETCWKNQNELYYLTDAGSRIFLYSIDKRASFLVYGGLAEETNISNLNCNNETVGFTADSINDGVLSTYLHYTLADTGYSGVRPESVTPLYFDMSLDTFKVSVVANGFKIDLIYDNEDGLNSSKEEILVAAKDQLASKGVDVGQSRFNFGF